MSLFYFCSCDKTDPSALETGCFHCNEFQSMCVVSQGRVVMEYKTSGSFQNHSSEVIDLKKFYQGCGHMVHNGSLYFHIAGTSNIGR